MRPLSLVAAFVLCFCLPLAANAVVYLEANFDIKLVGEPIGTGGAEIGEPVDVSSTVVARIQGDPMPTPFLMIQDDDDYYAGSARFEFLDGEELTTGSVVVTANLWFPEYENTFLYVREQGTAARAFTTLQFSENGSVYCSDANGSLGAVAEYETNRHILIVMIYNMDAGFYTIRWDGETVVSTREHGVSDRGVGALLFGCSNDADYDGALYVDDLFVADYPRMQYHLRANFNYKDVDVPIGDEGAEIGEPMRIDSFITATVRDEPMPTPCLEIQDTHDYAAGSVLFEFLGGAEVYSGLLFIEAQLWFDVYDDYQMIVREHGGSAENFLFLYFSPDGSIYVEDAGGPVGTFWGYETGRTHAIRQIVNMDAGTYDLYFDGQQLVDNETHDVPSRGIGRVGFGCAHDPDYDGTFYVDNVWVAHLAQNRPAACCREELCSLVIPRDCVYLAGEIQEGTWSCNPNPCIPSGVAEYGGSDEGLLSAVPNPFNGATTLRFRSREPGSLRLSIFDAAGRRVRRVFSPPVSSGELVWDGRDDQGIRVAPGVYFARLRIGTSAATQTLIVLE
ncbi:MAG: T9SS type A sorting domain-containing protein [Candidatus Eisenbacteria bacterium]|nr:T9SS type A sorting domain-containing protein [Candidatus Latescibacterota bacterium]MBD3302872.1 T9SS type A sorting domain-containing protein [Candidatus Eisenbacteria bacterium]